MIVIGVDPGLTGAMTLLHAQRGILECADIPTCPNGTVGGSMRHWIDTEALSEVFKGWYFRHELALEAVSVAIERPIPMPSLPAQTIASQFDTFGVLRAVLARAGEVIYVNPSAWKKLFGVGSDKEKSRACVQRLYPNAAQHFARKKDHNRAESALIAHFVLRSRA